MKNKYSKLDKFYLALSFILPSIYWIYLFYNSQMDIVFDAFGYENVGRLFYQNGIIEYFTRGPSREPLYSLIISLSMRISDMFSCNYQNIQKIIQIFILFLTQVLSLKLLQKLNVRASIAALIITYIGFSPALVNSTFSLFSEIITYPLVLSIVLVLIITWQSIEKDHIGKILLYGIYLGILFILIASVKAIFEFILPLILLPFFIILIKYLFQNNKKAVINVLIFIIVSTASFHLYINVIKHYKFVYSGEYNFSNRGHSKLYGTTEQRMSAKSKRKLLSAIAMVPGDGVCKSFFKKKECLYWSFFETDKLGRDKMAELEKELGSVDLIKKRLMKLIKRKILSNPVKYLGFCIIEGCKMFFWESTQVGCVVYPSILKKIFNFSLFKNGIRLLISLLSLISFIYSFPIIFKNIHLLLKAEDIKSKEIQSYFFVFLMISSFIGIHSLFCLLTRYAFPIAPLHLVNIGYFLNNLTLKKKN